MEPTGRNGLDIRHFNNVIGHLIKQDRIIRCKPLIHSGLEALFYYYYILKRICLKGSGRAANNEAKSVFTLLIKGKTRRFTKARSYLQGVQRALCPEGERAWGSACFMSARLQANWGPTSRWLRLGRRGGRVRNWPRSRVLSMNCAAFLTSGPWLRILRSRASFQSTSLRMSAYVGRMWSAGLEAWIKLQKH